MEGSEAKSAGAAERTWNWGAAALLLVAVALVFGRSVGFPFVDWDDKGYIVRNPMVHSPLVHGWVELLTSRAMGYPQPLTLVSQHLDYLVGGGAPWAFHLTNLLCHGLNALLLWGILRTYRLPRFATTFAVLLVSVHPIVVEPVCWATGRKDLLSVCFVLLGFLIYRRYLRGGRPASDAPPSSASTWAWAGALVACTILSLGAKPLGIVLPVLVLAEQVVERRRPSRPLLLAALLAAAASVAHLLFSMAGQESVGAVQAAGLGDRLLFSSQHLALQLRNTLAPAELTPKYLEGLPHPLLSAWGAAGIGACALVGGALVWALRRRRRRLAFGLLWALIAFAPSSGLIPLSRGPADTYFYLPIFGLALPLALGAAALLRFRPLTARITGAALVLCFSLAAYIQTAVWSSSPALWATLVDAYPQHRASWWALADAYADIGLPRRAVAVYEEALQHLEPPDTPELYLSMGHGCFVAADYACARTWYGRAHEMAPADPRAALRLLSACAVEPDAPPPDRLENARQVVRAALADLPLSPGDLTRFASEHLSGDGDFIPGLSTFADDEAAGPAARALLRGVRAGPAQ